MIGTRERTPSLNAIQAIPGVEDLSIAYRGRETIGDVFTSVSFTMFAIDPESFGQVAWYRDDFSEKPLPELMNLLAEDQLIKEGLGLPEGTETIGLWVRPIEPHPGLVLYAWIKDGLGHYIDYELGSPAAEGWQYLEAGQWLIRRLRITKLLQHYSSL